MRALAHLAVTQFFQQGQLAIYFALLVRWFNRVLRFNEDDFLMKN